MADFNKKDEAAKVDSQQTIEEAVSDFLKARQERIVVRRGRITDKIARKNDMQQDASSIASSLEFLSGDDRTVITGSTGENKSASGKSGSTKRRDSRKDGGADGKKSTVDSLDVQIEESRKQLEQIILDGEALVTNVRVAAENREKSRHIKQTENCKERIERLCRESEECQEMYDNLKPNWDIKGEKILPLDLHAQIKNQEDACEDLLTKKDDLIIALQREIEENDFEYETNLEKYQKDVSLVGDRIDDCVDDLQSAFLNELNLIEDYTCRNREVLLEENQREWMDLLDDFETMEEEHLKERKQDALNKFQILNDLYITVKQECRAMRQKFEDDLRILIQELEQIKYATQLNMEKLQYNLAIVRKRFKENVQMKNMMKRLLLKFNDRFTNKSRQLKAKMEAGRKEAKKILNDISRLEESLEQFGRKTLHLAVSDYNKYMDLWIVSEEIVRERLQKLLDSEKFIFETQLGVEAPIPELVFMDERPDAVTRYMQKKTAVYTEFSQTRKISKPDKNVNGKISTVGDDLEDETEEQQPAGPPKPEKFSGCQPNASLLLLSSESIEFIPGPEPDPIIQRRLMKHVAKVICDESGFIVEDELRRLLEPLMETERNLVNLDALLKALGINTVSEMQYLAHFLLKRCRVTKGVMSRIGSEYSAHLSEMNVSLEGIIGKNAVDDLESTSQSTKSKTPSPIQTRDDQPGSDNESEGSTEFKECECSHSPEGGQVEEEGKGILPMGETSVEILLPPGQHGQGRPAQIADGEGCSIIPELIGVDDQQLSLTEFVHEPTQCSPKCCSFTASEETIEEAIVIVEDDQDLDEALDTLAQEDEDESEEQELEGNSKCSTCGGEPHDHQDCSFYSSVATVLSWVDSDNPPNVRLRKSLHPAGSNVEVDQPTGEDGQTQFAEDTPLAEVIPTNTLPVVLIDNEANINDQFVPSAKPPSMELTPAAPLQDPLTKLSDVEDDGGEYGKPIRVYDEIQTVEVGRKSVIPPMGSPEEEDETETVSIMSLESSSNGSDEFMYIEPHEVIEALTEFCKDYNAKITVELPTLDELIDKKLKAFNYPRQANVMEYWERPARMLNAKSEDLWDTMQYCFEQYNKSLKERNGLVELVTNLYRQNFELSHLMQKHIQSAERFLPKPSPNRPEFRRANMKFC